MLISVVRTTGPGFLASRNRVNVMLTRCKEGMVIVTNKAFMQTRSVQNTLLGELCDFWGELAYDGNGQSVWKNWRTIAEGKCNLPGVKGRDVSVVLPISQLQTLNLSASPMTGPVQPLRDHRHSSTIRSFPQSSPFAVGAIKTAKSAFPPLSSTQNVNAPALLGQWAQGPVGVTKGRNVSKSQSQRSVARGRNAKKMTQENSAHYLRWDLTSNGSSRNTSYY